ncbi:MAG: TIGR03435 family protein [Terriglobales bacterium]
MVVSHRLSVIGKVRRMGICHRLSGVGRWRGRLAFAGLLLMAPLLAGQGSAAARRFDVASVKPTTNHRSVRMALLNNKADISGTLAETICAAYNIMDNQLVVDPRWGSVLQSWYRIEGKPQGQATKEQLQAMLRTLLAQRFRLRVVVATKTVRGYDLVIAKGGPRNLASAPPKRYDANLHPIGKRITVAQFASTWLGADSNGFLLSMRVPGAEPVVDKTGLTGTYDFFTPLGHYVFCPRIRRTRTIRPGSCQSG